MRLAGAPISWGVCEVPGWGHQLPPSRVLAEMVALGLTASELGPDGYLRPGLLEEYGLRPAGQFHPVVLHDPGHDPLPGLPDDVPGMLVLAAATGVDGYDARPALDERGWDTLLANLDRVAAAYGPAAGLHPHVGTMVETRQEVARVLDGSAIPLCLDTGHLLIGGTDPAELAVTHAARVAHVHLKDVDAALAAQVTRAELTYTQAVGKGLYRPLGQGDVDIAAIVAALGASGYTGWYVMEQDVILTGPHQDPAADVSSSLAYLSELSGAVG
ncbi:TIM barrel protein [Nonomuraea longicatena]|uniref:Sugar phosphate isomerase/epimerase n=1 Tax=Nonomuraea longicatena TaxID=83682 RepID=A0ABP4B057_9ACTN